MAHQNTTFYNDLNLFVHFTNFFFLLFWLSDNQIQTVQKRNIIIITTKPDALVSLHFKYKTVFIFLNKKNEVKNEDISVKKRRRSIPNEDVFKLKLQMMWSIKRVNHRILRQTTLSNMADITRISLPFICKCIGLLRIKMPRTLTWTYNLRCQPMELMMSLHVFLSLSFTHTHTHFCHIHICGPLFTI